MNSIDLNEIKMMEKNAVCIHDAAEISAVIDRIAMEMNQKLFDKAPIFLCVMNGALIFTGQLLTRLNFPLQLDYIHATRYLGEKRGKDLHWFAEPFLPLADRNVVILEDILDEGLTLTAVIEYCQQKGAKEIYTAALVNKLCPRKPGGVDKVDFKGFDIENKFLIGYGLDYKGFIRNLPGIYIVNT